MLDYVHWDDGSSPRVRGTGWRKAGPHALAAVHPRACGERETGAEEVAVYHRFIPARAGNGLDVMCGERTRRYVIDNL